MNEEHVKGATDKVVGNGKEMARHATGQKETWNRRQG
jgi:hypothetical protein